MSTGVHVAGIGMIPFTKPGKSAGYSEMGEQAARAALADVGLDYTQIEQAYVGYVYGDSTSGQSAPYGLRQTGIPIVNVNNNCSTGSSALWLAPQTNTKPQKGQRKWESSTARPPSSVAQVAVSDARSH